MIKQPTPYRIGTGATSLLMVLVILCLTIFSALCCSATASEKRLSQRMWDTEDAILAASNAAQKRIAQTDSLLLEARENAMDLPTLVSALWEILPYPARLQESTLSFTLPVNDHLQLQVSMDILPPTSPARYTLTEYLIAPVADINPEETLWN